MPERCPISFQNIEANQEGNKYSLEGLRQLSPRLTGLHLFPYSAGSQRQEAALRMQKMSIQGVQPKLSAALNITKKTFELQDTGGTFILKPQHNIFTQLPENEALTMRLAQISNIEVPSHGMIYSEDNSLTYFVQRFDRKAKGKKLAVEDFAQLLGFSRETKYQSSMEQCVDVIDNFCSFPMVEKKVFFKRVIFNFLTGNEDAHLKNFSLISRNGKIELSPAYDLVNTTILLRGPNIEELALPLAGKKRKLTATLLIDYFGKERLKLTETTLYNVLYDFKIVQVRWRNQIENSFLNDELKKKYFDLLVSRFNSIY
jgi:serine/threonine-protein kinase HipA